MYSSTDKPLSLCFEKFSLFVVLRLKFGWLIYVYFAILIKITLTIIPFAALDLPKSYWARSMKLLFGPNSKGG